MANIEIQVNAVEPFAEGRTFGEAGPYLRIRGVAKGELDPAAPANRVIVDLDKAPRNARGLVEYETDFFILRPVDPGRTNGVLVYDVTNRGSKWIFQLLDDAPSAPVDAANDPKTAREAGLGFCLGRGYSLVWSGWDPGAPAANNGLGARFPTAMENGRPITGRDPPRVSHRHPRAGQGGSREAELSGGLDRHEAGAADRARPRKRHPHRDPG